jgi:hypothetical protein
MFFFCVNCSCLEILMLLLSAELGIKGKKKKPLTFERGQVPREEARIKNARITVGEGMPADTGNLLLFNSVSLSMLKPIL